MLPASHVLPRFVTNEIRRYSKQPCTFVLDVRLSQRANERLLRNFLRPIAVPEAPSEVSHQRGVVGSEEAIDVRHSITIDLATAIRLGLKGVQARSA